MDSGDVPTDRRRLLVDAIVAERTGEEATPVVFEGVDRTVAYEDQRLRLEVEADAGRDRLDTLLSEYRAVKVAQPETRRADEGVVVLSAVTDAKHTADFVEAVFREVFDADEDYELRVD